MAKSLNDFLASGELELIEAAVRREINRWVMYGHQIPDLLGMMPSDPPTKAQDATKDIEQVDSKGSQE